MVAQLVFRFLVAPASCSASFSHSAGRILESDSFSESVWILGTRAIVCVERISTPFFLSVSFPQELRQHDDAINANTTKNTDTTKPSLQKEILPPRAFDLPRRVPAAPELGEGGQKPWGEGFLFGGADPDILMQDILAFDVLHGRPGEADSGSLSLSHFTYTPLRLQPIQTPNQDVLEKPNLEIVRFRRFRTTSHFFLSVSFPQELRHDDATIATRTPTRRRLQLHYKILPGLLTSLAECQLHPNLEVGLIGTSILMQDILAFDVPDFDWLPRAVAMKEEKDTPVTDTWAIMEVVFPRRLKSRKPGRINPKLNEPLNAPGEEILDLEDKRRNMWCGFTGLLLVEGEPARRTRRPVDEMCQRICELGHE